MFASNKQQKCIIISNLALFWLKLNKMCLKLNYVLILVIIPSFGRLSDLTENKCWQIKFYFSQIKFYSCQLHSYFSEILFTLRLCLTSSTNKRLIGNKLVVITFDKSLTPNVKTSFDVGVKFCGYFGC